MFVFIYILNTSTKVMFWSIKNMCKEVNTKSNKTVLNYIDVLEEIRLIKVGKVGTRVFLDGSTKKANNIYTLGYLEDTDNILQKQMDSYKEELKKLQKKYYEFIKLDDEKVENTPFIKLDDEVSSTET